MNINLNLCTQFRMIQNNIGIVYDPMCEYAKLMIEEYYSGPEFSNTIYLLTPANGFDFNISRPLNRDFIRGVFRCDFERIIFVNFDHLINEDYTARLNEYLLELQPDEIWEWQYENVINNKYQIPDKVRFMPLRYVSAYEEFRKSYCINPDTICHFIGNLAGRRLALFETFSYHYLNFQILSGRPICEFLDTINKAGFSLNIHSFEGNFREQLRISESICLGIPVMTESDTHPYYPGLVGEFNYNWAIQNPVDFFNWMSQQYGLYKPSTIAKTYKDMTNTEEAYESYKTSIIRTYDI